jgi:hypothetical protein
LITSGKPMRSASHLLHQELVAAALHRLHRVVVQAEVLRDGERAAHREVVHRHHGGRLGAGAAAVLDDGGEHALRVGQVARDVAVVELHGGGHARLGKHVDRHAVAGPQRTGEDAFAQREFPSDDKDVLGGGAARAHV